MKGKVTAQPVSLRVPHRCSNALVLMVSQVLKPTSHPFSGPQWCVYSHNNISRPNWSGGVFSGVPGSWSAHSHA